jgi:hypothetical protein
MGATKKEIPPVEQGEAVVKEKVDVIETRSFSVSLQNMRDRISFSIDPESFSIVIHDTGYSDSDYDITMADSLEARAIADILLKLADDLEKIQ